MFAMIGMALHMAKDSQFYSNHMWKREVWKKAWAIDSDDWKFTSSLLRDAYFLCMTVDKTEQYLA